MLSSLIYPISSQFLLTSLLYNNILLLPIKYKSQFFSSAFFLSSLVNYFILIYREINIIFY